MTLQCDLCPAETFEAAVKTRADLKFYARQHGWRGARRFGQVLYVGPNCQHKLVPMSGDRAARRR